jgi:hypothetical protein
MPARKITPLRIIHLIFPAGHFVISLLFIGCGLALIVFSCMHVWQAMTLADASIRGRVDTVLESLAVIAVALAALELGQTVIEEEVQRDAQMSAPTRVRRFLSRFMVVLVVALSIETLVLAFRFSHEAPENLPHAAVVGFSAAALLIAWGFFVKLNRSAEELEPEAMRDAKAEDKKVNT